MNESKVTEHPGFEFDFIGQLVIRVPAGFEATIQSVKIGDRVFMEVQSQNLAPAVSTTGEVKRGSMVTQKCAYCEEDFKYKFSTRPRTFCDHCKVSRNSKSIRESAARKKKSDKAASDRPPIGRTIASRCSDCGKKFQYVYQGRRVRTKCDSCKGAVPSKAASPKRPYHRKPKEKPVFSASGMKPPNIDEPQDKTVTRHAQGKMLDIPLSRRLGTQGD